MTYTDLTSPEGLPVTDRMVRTSHTFGHANLILLKVATIDGTVWSSSCNLQIRGNQN